MNTRLATLIARNLAEAGAEVRQISLGDYPLPLIDARQTSSQIAVRSLAGRITQATRWPS